MLKVICLNECFSILRDCLQMMMLTFPRYGNFMYLVSLVAVWTFVGGQSLLSKNVRVSLFFKYLSENHFVVKLDPE